MLTRNRHFACSPALNGLTPSGNAPELTSDPDGARACLISAPFTSDPMHRFPITPRRFLFRAFRLAVFAGALAVSSGFAQTQASAAVNSPSAPGDVQKLASFVVE